MVTSASMLAVLIHSPVKFSGRRQLGSTLGDWTGFNLMRSGDCGLELR